MWENNLSFKHWSWSAVFAGVVAFQAVLKRDDGTIRSRYHRKLTLSWKLDKVPDHRRLAFEPGHDQKESAPRALAGLVDANQGSVPGLRSVEEAVHREG